MSNPVLPLGKKTDYFPVDFSVNNPFWEHDDITKAANQQRYLDQMMVSTDKTVGYGGFLEIRGLYNSASRFQQGNSRDIHLGLDLWASAGAPVRSVLEGKLHSLGILKDQGNYGGVVILEHSLDKRPIYALYGHLSWESIKAWIERYSPCLRAGRFRESKLNTGNVIQTSLVATPEEDISVPQNSIIGYLGNPDENGGYAPHLHFQLMMELHGYIGDYPGVASQQELTEVRRNLLDPGRFLGLY